jgi:hypothetical protein
MTARYLAVPDADRASLAHYDPVYGSTLIDGRTVAKVRVEVGVLPGGVDDLGTDPAEVRQLLAPGGGVPYAV